MSDVDDQPKGFAGIAASLREPIPAIQKISAVVVESVRASTGRVDQSSISATQVSDDCVAAALALLESSRDLSANISGFLRAFADAEQLARCRAAMAIESMREIPAESDGLRRVQVVMRESWRDEDIVSVIIAAMGPLTGDQGRKIVRLGDSGRAFVVTTGRAGTWMLDDA